MCAFTKSFAAESSGSQKEMEVIRRTVTLSLIGSNGSLSGMMVTSCEEWKGSGRLMALKGSNEVMKNSG